MTGNNTGITAVDVSGVNDHDVTLTPDAPATPLKVAVRGQIGVRKTGIEGGSQADDVTVSYGNVNVETGDGADTVTLAVGGYSDRVNLGAGDDTLKVQGIMGAATLDGGPGVDTLSVTGDADLTGAFLTGFEKLAFGGTADASLTVQNTLFADSLNPYKIGEVIGTKGKREVLNISMENGGSLDLSALNFTDWTNGEDKTVVTTSKAGGDTINLSAAGSDTVRFDVFGTPAAHTVKGVTFGATNAEGDVIAFSGKVTGLRGAEYERVAAPNSALGANTGLVVYTAATVADEPAAPRHRSEPARGFGR